ncbi:hypothetical protein F4801DRAFT_416330 [Xylaria longipes]|nr:hypothetical protein F4801DRAFT_416330 [Xylaria longipes]
MSRFLHDLRISFELHLKSLSERINATSPKMQPGNPQEPESVLPRKRVSSFGRFIKRTYSLAKKEKESTSSSVTPEGVLNASTPVYARPRRHHNPTEADFNNHALALQTALDDAWPRRHHSRYRNARALLVCWADGGSTDSHSLSPSPGFSPPPSFRFSSGSDEDSLAGMSSDVGMITSRRTIGQDMRQSQGPFIPAAHQLAGVLESRYGIQSQVWMIPSLESPQEMLAGKVKQFVEEYGGPDNLLIFWYGGHAEFAGAAPNEGASGGDRSVGEVIWYGLRDELGISARTISKTLGLARADVLMLNDSPFAQHAYTGHICGPGSFELLGSGSTNPSNAEPNPAREGSFTRTLALMLDSPFLATRGVSVLELHRKLLDTMSPSRTSLDTASPRRTRRTLPSPPLSPTNAETEQQEPTRARRRRPTSSLIVARAQNTAQAPPYPVYCQISQSTPLERDARRNIVLSRLDTSLAAETNYARTVGEPRVKLDIRLKRPYLDVRRWKEWVLRAPADADGIAVRVCGNGEQAGFA